MTATTPLTCCICGRKIPEGDEFKTTVRFGSEPLPCHPNCRIEETPQWPPKTKHLEVKTK